MVYCERREEKEVRRTMGENEKDTHTHTHTHTNKYIPKSFNFVTDTRGPKKKYAIRAREILNESWSS
jgi:hypothetical protein